MLKSITRRNALLKAVTLHRYFYLSLILNSERSCFFRRIWLSSGFLFFSKNYYTIKTADFTPTPVLEAFTGVTNARGYSLALGSQQHAGLQHEVFQPQQEETRPKTRFM